MQWEYQQCDAPADEALHVMAAAGLEGWELAGTIGLNVTPKIAAVIQGPPMKGLRMFFKRPVDAGDTSASQGSARDNEREAGRSAEPVVSRR